MSAPRSPTAVSWSPPTAPLAIISASWGGTSAAATCCGTCSASADAKIVPVMARPTVPPTCWKKVRLLLAAPRRATGTLFWTMRMNTANVGPTPTPVTNM